MDFIIIYRLPCSKDLHLKIWPSLPLWPQRFAIIDVKIWNRDISSERLKSTVSNQLSTVCPTTCSWPFVWGMTFWSTHIGQVMLGTSRCHGVITDEKYGTPSTVETTNMERRQLSQPQLLADLIKSLSHSACIDWPLALPLYNRHWVNSLRLTSCSTILYYCGRPEMY